MNFDKYVKFIEDSCGKEKDFIIIFKNDLREEAIEIIKKNMKIERNISNIMIQGKLKEKEATLFCHGKLIIKGFKSREELEKFLSEIF